MVHLEEGKCGELPNSEKNYDNYMVFSENGRYFAYITYHGGRYCDKVCLYDLRSRTSIYILYVLYWLTKPIRLYYRIDMLWIFMSQSNIRRDGLSGSSLEAWSFGGLELWSFSSYKLHLRGTYHLAYYLAHNYSYLTSHHDHIRLQTDRQYRL